VLEFAAELTTLIHELDPPLVMMSMKRFIGQQKSLSMSGSGMLFALDLMRTHDCSRFAAALDELVVAFDAQPNVAKDSRIPAQIARRALPQYESFRRRIRELDPDRLYESELSKRLEV
jgi:decaprenylphospho-beta-D-ribofuranose 2-oxidase